MRKIVTTTALAATLASGLVASTTIAADAAISPRVAPTGERTCVEPTGTTVQKVALNNRGSSRQVTYKVIRTVRKNGTAVQTSGRRYLVGAGKTLVVPMEVPSRHTLDYAVSVVEAPKAGTTRGNVQALPGCVPVVFDPAAVIGPSSCIGTDTVVRVGLDNTRTTHDVAEYVVTAFGEQGTTDIYAAVDAKSARNTYVSLAPGETTDITVAVGDVVLASETVGASDC